MATHPLTRVTTWYVGHLQRNRREWISAMICMFGFWNPSFGHWNLALLVIVVVGAKLTRAKVVRRALRRFVDYYLDVFEAMVRRRLIRRGAAVLIQRFPKMHVQHGFRLLARQTVQDDFGCVIYRIGLYADPKRARDVDNGVEYLTVVVAILDLTRSPENRTQTMRLPVEDFTINSPIWKLDPSAPHIRNASISVRLLSGKPTLHLWRLNNRANSPTSPAQAATPKSLIIEAIKKIADRKTRAAANALAERDLRSDDEISAARRDFAKLLHPDICKEPNAQEALALINAQLDLAEKLAA